MFYHSRGFSWLHAPKHFEEQIRGAEFNLGLALLHRLTFEAISDDGEGVEIALHGFIDDHIGDAAELSLAGMLIDALDRNADGIANYLGFCDA